MVPLDTRDVSDLVGLVYDSALERHQWKGLMERLTALCPGHVAAVATFDGNEWVSSGPGGLPDGLQGEQIEELKTVVHRGAHRSHSDLHEVLATRLEISLGTLISTRDACSDDELHAFETYRYDMAPVGAGHWTAFNYSMSGRRRAAIMVVENDRDETPKDNARVRELLSLVGPHATRAARIARSLTLSREASEVYRGFIDAIALPLIIVDAEARLEMANTSAQRLLERGVLIDQDATDRVALMQASGSDLRRLLDEADTSAGPVGVRLQDAEGSVSLCVAPFRPTMTLGTEIDRQLFGRQNLFALFFGAQDDGPIHKDLLRDVFDLTPREADVCALLATGKRPSVIARKAGRSEKTIRNQIQAIHEKVGVTSHRQLSDALAVFRTVAAMFDADGPIVPERARLLTE